MDFDEFFETFTGHAKPHPWQRSLAEHPLPELVEVETAGGKTAAIVAAWFWRRLLHPDPEVRRATPTRLVIALPMRALVDQHQRSIQGWCDRLDRFAYQSRDLVTPAVHRLVGGEGTLSKEWVRHPERPAILVGTIDQLLSRALNRGYLSSRMQWPIEFGLLSSDTHWVLDEVQLMGPAVTTTRQLQSFRELLGTMAPCTTTWMSATVDHAKLTTVDRPELPAPVTLTEADRNGSLARSLEAVRHIEELPVGGDPASAVADAVALRHRAGTLTLVVCNTVKSAQAMHKALGSRSGVPDAVLVHSRYRPGDRAGALERIIADPLPDEGVVAVATQVIEAGVDISAALMVTEAAPWESLVQRFGRLNRDGRSDAAALAWVHPAHAAPYDEAAVEVAVAALRAIEGSDQTTPTFLAAGPSWEGRRTYGAVLRRRDLLALFDTQPDLDGNDIDIGPYIRDGDDLDATVFWRDLEDEQQRARTLDIEAPTPAELCPVPVGDLRSLKARLWRFDHLARTDEGKWRVVTDPRTEVRPGQVYALTSSVGNYRPDRGWDTAVRGRVEPVESGVDEMQYETVGDDPLTYCGSWVTLADHLADAAEQANRLLDELDGLDIDPAVADAVVTGARLHDLGKVHPVFQASLRCQAEDLPARLDWIDSHGPLAKSVQTKMCPYERRGFRHELASALMLLNPECDLLDDVAEPDLVLFLVAAHHGRVRLGARPLRDTGRPRSRSSATAPSVLGVESGDTVDEVVGPGFRTAAMELDIDVFSVGRSPDGMRSWTSRMLELVDRADLGPFRLAYLEALVRVADWRASEQPSRESKP